MRGGRAAKVVALVLVPVLLFGVGGAQPVPGAGGWPGFGLGELRDRLRDGIGFESPGSSGVVEEPSVAQLALPREDPVPTRAGRPEGRWFNRSSGDPMPFAGLHPRDVDAAGWREYMARGYRTLRTARR